MAGIEDSNDSNSKPRDLLRRLGSDFSRKYAAEERIGGGGGGGGGENIELSLGLSLNGRFGVDPQKGSNNLIRASSVSNFTMSCSSNDEKKAGEFLLLRTCSLPAAATEEECRKRKELQSLRRLEAKRKRVEKMKNGRVVVVKEKVEVDRNSDENEGGSVVNNGSEGVELKSEEEGLNKSQVISQGSIGSQGSGSSGISDFDNQQIQGVNKFMGARSPSSEQYQPENKGVVTHAATAVNRKLNNAENGFAAVRRQEEKEENIRKFMMGDMPCVTTKLEGPDGKRVEGFLYRYKKGEEVKIMCVCHGSFLSPAEFIKHGGGEDVENPLRHIVICPTPFSCR